MGQVIVNILSVNNQMDSIKEIKPDIITYNNHSCLKLREKH